MKLMLIEGPVIQLVAHWMEQEENYQWLDFGSGNQLLSATALKFMTQRDTHLLRVFTPDEDYTPIGVVVLTDINHKFKTARLWAVLGDKGYGAKGYTRRAISKILTIGFDELGLESVYTWIVDKNAPSIRMTQHLNFTFSGRQRRCHYIDGQPCDRLLADLLASEHKGL